MSIPLEARSFESRVSRNLRVAVANRALCSTAWTRHRYGGRRPAATIDRRRFATALGQPEPTARADSVAVFAALRSELETRIRAARCGLNFMQYIDPHIHMVSRVTDDYETLARMGCVGMSEPAFWAGFDRSSADSFRDYFRQLTDFEPRRAESLWHPAFHLDLHQRQRSGERAAGARRDRADSRVSAIAGRVGHRRNRPEQEHAERIDHVLRASRTGRAARASRF